MPPTDTLYLLVRIESPAGSFEPATLVAEVQSNLESVSDSLDVLVSRVEPEEPWTPSSTK